MEEGLALIFSGFNISKLLTLLEEDPVKHKQGDLL